jgi:xanthine dehydrogenase molybdopterin-binding subunit B
VKYTLTRQESIKTTGKRNSQRLRYKIGAKKDGSITAITADITARGGAYASVEEAVILRSVSFAAGPYTIPNAAIQAKGVYTNNMPTCAMKGFGNPPVMRAALITMVIAAAELIPEKTALMAVKVLGFGEFRRSDLDRHVRIWHILLTNISSLISFSKRIEAMPQFYKECYVEPGKEWGNFRLSFRTAAIR